MNKNRRIHFIIQLICTIGWITAYVIEKLHYFEGYPTTGSQFYGSFRVFFVIASFINILIYFYNQKKEDDKT